MTTLPQERRLHRGLVMHALQAQYPLPLTQTTLERQVAHFIAAEALPAIVHYLAELGLMEVHTERVGTIQVTTYRLTAQGYDVADGSVASPGIDMGRG